MNIAVNNLCEIYDKLGPELQKQPEVISRNHVTKELIQTTIELVDPRNNLMYCEGRNFNIMFAIAESLLLFNKTNDLKCFSHFNKKVEDFSDDGQTLYGAYGHRIHKALANAYKKLKASPDTRQCYIPINERKDFTAKTKDVPCTLGFQFMVRDNKLSMHTYMRSNDIIWGLPYDIFNFTNAQMVLANSLGLELGSYFHTVTSLHVYNYHYSVLENILKNSKESISYNNIHDIKEWKQLGNFYVNGIVPINKVDFCTYNPGWNQTFMMLANEQCYLNKMTVPFSKTDIMNVYHMPSPDLSDDWIYEDWFIPFTKRWYKNND